jgi:subtilisin family serine protease
MSKRFAVAAGLLAAGLALGVAIPAWAATSYPNDYFFVTGDDQWALTGTAASINAPAASCASTGAGIVAADVDTGANFSHPDLAGKLIAGAAFLGGTAPDKDHPTGTGQSAVQDDNGHGSMTTGIMVADTNNGQGIAAVAPDARALIVKVLDSNGRGYDSDIADGIEWAADHGAQVINLSIGPGDIAGTGVAPPGTAATSLIPGAIQYAYDHGVAVAVAAGNSGISTADYLTLRQQATAVTVGALGPADMVASYSNYGYGVSLYAPGGDAPPGTPASIHNLIVSTFVESGGADYGIGQGTSFAAPHAAGVLAQLMATGMSAHQAIGTIDARTATSADGFPQLDAAGALGRSKSALCGTPSTGGAIAPSGVVGPGGKPAPVPAATSRPAPPHSAAARTAVPVAGAPAPSASASTSAPAPGVVKAPAGLGVLPRSRATTPPGSSGGGAPSPLLLAALVGVVVLGAPLGRSVIMRLRRPRGPA